MTQEDKRWFFRETRNNITQFKQTTSLFLRKYLKPFLWFIIPIWSWLAPRYVSLYKKMAYKDGVHVPSKGAGALAVLSAGTVFALYLNIWHILPALGRLTYDTVAYNAFSYQTETLYFSSPQWVTDDSGEGDKVLSVFSCPTRHCDIDSSTEYRFRDSAYLDLIYWVTKFEPYDPADVAGILISELNYCTATAFGKRFKPLDWYPYISALSCTAIPSSETGANVANPAATAPSNENPQQSNPGIK